MFIFNILKKKPKILATEKKIKNYSFNYELNYKIHKFGDKNPKKIFYVIRRNPGSGMFSNINYVIHHLFIAERFNFIPIIDMESFPNYYNEKHKIFGSRNSWQYYFYPVNKYKLKEVYSSKKVIICGRESNNNPYITGYKKLPYQEAQYFRKYLKFKPYILRYVKKYEENVFKNKKVLGVHFRGSDQKISTNHPFPPTLSQIIINIDELIKKYKYDLIFLIKEETYYYDYLKKKYKEKLVAINSYRSNYDIFSVYARKNHRYLLGLEILINTLILSKTSHILGNNSNVISSAISFSRHKKLITKINNGNNSKNILVAFFLWKIMSIIPEFFGGFKLKYFGTRSS